MEKRYQVFISSTFQDLAGARQEVSQALLRADCFPAGMELFPAADQEQFAFIKQVIQQSDYYIIISAGRYGSLHPETGLSYTEMEYDYAVDIGKPVIRLLHKDPFNKLTGDKIEKSNKGRKQLERFRARLSKSKLVSYWLDPKELGQHVVLGLVEISKRHPSHGWVRGDHALSVELLQELGALREQSKNNSDTEVVVNFDDRTGFSKVKILVANKGDGADEYCLGDAKISNKILAERIFLSLLLNKEPVNVAITVSDHLTEKYEFSSDAMEHEHYWLEVSMHTILNGLMYLESRGLVTGNTDILGASRWSLTSRGRQHAAFIRASQEFG